VTQLILIIQQAGYKKAAGFYIVFTHPFSFNVLNSKHCCRIRKLKKHILWSKF